MSRNEGERRLIVNADDLGRTAGINSGTFEAHREGLVTSATLMVNFPTSAAAGRALAEHPALGVGLHLVFSGGRTTLPPSAVPSLVDQEGRLPPRPERLKDPDAAEVLAEVEAQLALFRELTGRAPTHLDGHHHCHRLPVIRDAVLAVARREGLPVRNVSPEVGRRLREEEIATTDSFDESFYGEPTGVKDLLEILDGLPPGTTELMCHPAHVDDELREGSSYAEPRVRELASLTDPQVLRRVEDLGIRLVHFGEL